MKVLVMSTKGQDMRSEATGWTCEDTEQVHAAIAAGRRVNMVDAKTVGMVGGPRGGHAYATPLFALANGWKLLAPPRDVGGEWEWWFTHD